jgi:hypothetical protein
MGSKSNRKSHVARRDLRRDEIAAPEIGGVLGEWQRDAGYMRYRIIRRLGPLGPVVAVLAIIGILVGLVLRFV